MFSLCHDRKFIALLTVTLISIPSYYLLVSAPLQVVGMNPWRVRSNAVVFAFSSLLERINSIAVSGSLDAYVGRNLHATLVIAARNLSSGMNQDLVAYETVTGLDLPIGSTILMLASSIQSQISETLNMSIEDVHRVALIISISRNSYHTKNYTSLVSPADCQNNTLAIIMIPTLPSSFDRRNVIREMWGNRLLAWDLRLVFVMGIIPNVDIDKLYKEHVRHGDTLLIDFQEDYYNLTLKCLLAIRWVSSHCSAARHLVKADDDVYVYPENLHSLLLRRPNLERTIIGNVGRGFLPHRFLSSKWYMPLDLYAAPGYPVFVFGPCYILSASILEDLFDSCAQLRYLHLEDVFITGVCAKEIRTPLIHEQVLPFLVNRCSNRHAVAAHHSKEEYVAC